MIRAPKEGVPFIVSQPISPIAEQFRIIRARVLSQLKTGDMSTLLVSSTNPGEGKTFVSANFAVSVAKVSAIPVLLVDTDLRKPTLHKVFELRKEQPGLTNFFSKGSEVSSLIVNTAIPNLSVLPAGPGSRDFSEGVPMDRMRQLLNQVKVLYGNCYVVLDSSPMNLFADARQLAEIADGVIMVVKARETRQDEVKKTIALLGKGKVLGVVLNYCREVSKAHDHYYGYYGIK